jgi:hypothetical protein
MVLLRNDRKPLGATIMMNCQRRDSVLVKSTIFWSINALLVTLFLVAQVRAQEDSGESSSFVCKNTSTMHCVDKGEIRRFEYQYQLAEQPAFLVASVDGTPQVVANPEGYLQQQSVVFQLSELFPSTSNLSSIVTAISGNPENKQTELRLGRFCSDQLQIRCLAAGGNFWERLLSGVSGNFSLAERDEVQQGVLTSQSFSQHYGPAGEIDFDPSSLFVTGSSWKNAVAALKGITAGEDVFGQNSDERRCFMKDPGPGVTPLSTDACIKIFSSPRLNAATARTVASALIPKFQFKAVDQYDFLKNGGVLVQVPGLQRSLKTYSLTWDIRHLIPSTADRLAVLAAYKSYSPPPGSTSAASTAKLCITISGSGRGYVPVTDNVNAEMCRSLAEAAHADSFALACASETSVVIGAPSGAHNKAEELHLPESNACRW